MSAQKHKEGSIDLSFSGFKKRWKALLHFRTPLPPIIIDDWSWKNAAESFAVALTLT